MLSKLKLCFALAAAGVVLAADDPGYRFIRSYASGAQGALQTQCVSLSGDALSLATCGDQAEMRWTFTPYLDIQTGSNSVPQWSGSINIWGDNKALMPSNGDLAVGEYDSSTSYQWQFVVVPGGQFVLLQSQDDQQCVEWSSSGPTMNSCDTSNEAQQNAIYTVGDL